MSEEKEVDGQMSFLQHLEELRWRLVRSVVAILLFAITAFVFKDFLFNTLIFGPYKPDFPTYQAFCWISQSLGLGDAFCLEASAFALQTTNMAGQFMAHIVAAFMAGLVCAFPYVFWELWRFVKPGLQKKEQKMAKGIVFYTSFLFLLGVFFGYFVIAPLSVQFLGGYSISDLVKTQPTINSYISTVVSVTLASGILFLLPIVVYMFSKLGLLTPTFLRKYRRHSIVGVLVLAAIITPPDIASQIVVALPVLLLYEMSIFISARVVRKKEAAAQGVK